jgi:hypothetical protein
VTRRRAGFFVRTSAPKKRTPGRGKDLVSIRFMDGTGTDRGFRINVHNNLGRANSPQTVSRKKERSGLQSACDELIDNGAIITRE